MDKEVRKNRPAFRGRDAAMLGGIAGGVWGANAPLKAPYEIGRIVDANIRNNPDIPIPYDWEDAAIMSSGGYTALTGAGMGALGGAAAYQLLKGLGKGVKAVSKKVVNSKTAGQSQMVNQAVNNPNIKANNN